MPQLLCFLVAAVLFSGAALLQRPARRSGLDLGRDLVRPVVLPVLWRGLEKAELQAGPEEYIARGRLLLQFLPQWTDGHVHFAWQLAFEAAKAQKDPEHALHRLLAALAFLENALSVGPTRPVEILEAMAYMVQIRGQDPALAKVFREQVGKEPAERADDYLKRAQKIDPSQARAEQRVIVRVALIAGLLRTRNRRAARELLDATLGRLAGFRDQQLAAEWRAALLDLRSYLTGKAELGDLEKYPHLDEVLDALRKR
ncbi:MAG: hypothetical protein ACYTKC_01490 [Planctomycetota bacterium]|jgi:hypothetical protein